MLDVVEREARARHAVHDARLAREEARSPPSSGAPTATTPWITRVLYTLIQNAVRSDSSAPSASAAAGSAPSSPTALQKRANSADERSVS